MIVNDDAYWLSQCGALKTIASKPAPTHKQRCFKTGHLTMLCNVSMHRFNGAPTPTS